MTTIADGPAAGRTPDADLSLYNLLDPEVLANPYPLYQRLRSEDPVHWDLFLHAWVVTRYGNVVTVLQQFSAARTPTPDQLAAMGLQSLSPMVQVMMRQLLFLDPPIHSRVRRLTAKAFAPRHVEMLRRCVQEIVDSLLDRVQHIGRMDVIADLADPLPSMVNAAMLGVPIADADRLKVWSTDFSEVLGNFQTDPTHVPRLLQSLEEMTAYFRSALHGQRRRSDGGMISILAAAEEQGDRLTEDEVIADCIVNMVGGQEMTTNLIGNGLLSLLRHPEELQQLRAHPELIPSAVEELLRYDSPVQYTARRAPEDRLLAGKQIGKRQAVLAVLGAANRDPERFPDPNRLDLRREDNRHLAFGWGHHYCIGAPLARIEGELVFKALLHRLPDLRLAPGPLTWRNNPTLHGLTALPVAFSVVGSGAS